jgi:DNA-binding response OmpR family regulator
MSGKRILAVEDDRAVAHGLQHGLQAEGYHVIFAETDAQALEHARRHRPHLVLLDVRLPDASGLDVCRTLRAEGRTMPTIVVTALDDEVDEVLGLELGADDYVVEPYSLRELLSRVRALLRRSYGVLAPAPGSARLVFGGIEIDQEPSPAAALCNPGREPDAARCAAADWPASACTAVASSVAVGPASAVGPVSAAGGVPVCRGRVA